MKLSSTQSGNLWNYGELEHFFCLLPDGIASVQARVTDYWGHELYNQPVKVDANKATVSIPSLLPGWYTLTLTADAKSISCTFGVVLPSNKGLGPHEGKVCADAAAAWQLDQSQYEAFADVVQTIGLPMVRERIWWNDIEPSQGVFNWGRYDKLIDAYSKRGIKVDEVWHDTPEWAKARPGSGTGIPPKADSLRGFCLEGAKHYRGKVNSWEVWNEPDNSGAFFDGTPQEFYNVMAVAYKALKEGSNDEAKVLQGAMCLKHPSQFARDLFKLGAAKYTDAFNWHSYEPPDSYKTILNDYRQTCNLGEMPSWMTEAGIFLGATDNGELNSEDARRQCEFVPKSVALSLACGNTKHFFFLLPYRNENGACLGALRKDLTPNPSLIALSTAARFLGDSKYLRTTEFNSVTSDNRQAHVTSDNRQAHVTAVIFSDANGGETAVAWASEPCVASYQGGTRNINSVKVLNIFGCAETVATNASGISLQLSAEPIYILLPAPKPLFPFNETFSSGEDTGKRWVHRDNGGTSNVSGGYLAITGSGPGYPTFETLGNPFPTTGDWTASVGYRYTTIGNYGAGVEFVQSNGNPIASIHQDVNGQYVALGTHQVWHTEANTHWHVVSFVYSNQQLQVFVDNVTQGESLRLSELPSSIHIGGGIMPNPWDWNNLTLRFVRVNLGTQPLQLSTLKEGNGFTDALP